MSEQPERIVKDSLPILVDIPATVPGFGFDAYVKSVAAAIMGGKPPQFTIGLYGPWGSGKTSLLGAIGDRLENRYSNRPLVARFDAWRYADHDSLLIPLLVTIRKSLSERLDPQTGESNSRWAQMREAFGKVALGLARGLQVKVSLPGDLVEVGYDGSQITSGNSVSEEESEHVLAELEKFYLPFDALTAIARSNKEDGQSDRIVILVDDLDRCKPESIVKVLQAIHMLTDIEGIIFVLALDYGYLQQAIVRQYGDIDADRYIEKIVQVPFHIPRLRMSDGQLDEMIPNWSRELRSEFGGFEDLVEKMLDRGMRSNPRAVKRLLNTYLLTRDMYHRRSGATVDDKTLFRVLGLQVGWHEAFRNLAVSLATSEEADMEDPKLPEWVFPESDPSGSPVDIEDRDRHQFFRDLFNEVGDLNALREVVQLAAATEAEDDTEARTYTQITIEKMSESMGALLNEIVAAVRQFPHDRGYDSATKLQASYLSLAWINDDGVGRSFASLRLRRNQIYVDVDLDRDEEWALLTTGLTTIDQKREWPTIEIRPDHGKEYRDQVIEILRISYLADRGNRRSLGLNWADDPSVPYYGRGSR